jgi:endonuclease/exonuclease/phosphatase family metal-dependent hydrolase
VVSWNIRAGIGPGEPFPPAWWRHVRLDRLEAIAGFIAALRADAVTLQEVSILNVDGAVVDEPALLAAWTGLPVRYGAAHAFPLVDPGTGATVGSAMWGNALLTRHPVADGFVRGLPRAADDDHVEPAGVDHPLAGVRYADVEPGHREARCAVGGRTGPVRVVTAHLTYIGRDQRRRQVEALADLATGLPDPVVVTGDLNAPIEADEVALLRDRFVDAFGVVGVPPGDERRRSAGAVAIDHVLVRGLEVLTCRVATEAGDLSDHWPVVADLRRPAGSETD